MVLLSFIFFSEFIIYFPYLTGICLDRTGGLTSLPYFCLSFHILFTYSFHNSLSFSLSVLISSIIPGSHKVGIMLPFFDSVYSCLFFFLTGLHFFHLFLGLLLLSLLFWSCSFSFSFFFFLCLQHHFLKMKRKIRLRNMEVKLDGYLFYFFVYWILLFIYHSNP